MYKEKEMELKHVWGMVNEEFSSYEVEEEEQNELAAYQDILNEIEVEYDIEDEIEEEWDEDQDDFHNNDF